jgi:maleate isomerase
MYGYRARIGYTSPLLLAEVFVHEFSMVAPKGVTLVISTGMVWQYTPEALEQTYQHHLRAAREMGRAGVNVIVLGGVPVNMARGFDKVGELIKAMEAECGAPVSTSVTAQINALRQVGARRLGLVNTNQAPFRRPEDDYLTLSGFQTVASASVEKDIPELGRLPSAVNAKAARNLVREHPGIDTLYFPTPHRAILDQVEPLEQELGVTVITASQAIFWEAFRRCGIKESVPGFGRLLREPWDF